MALDIVLGRHLVPLDDNVSSHAGTHGCSQEGSGILVHCR